MLNLTSTNFFLGWTVELDSFTEEETVVGAKKFTNVIANLDPEAEGRLVLACHIDSMSSIGKLFI
jgi:glutaminyl-peptide cyclotransferase